MNVVICLCHRGDTDFCFSSLFSYVLVNVTLLASGEVCFTPNPYVYNRDTHCNMFDRNPCMFTDVQPREA